MGNGDEFEALLANSGSHQPWFDVGTEWETDSQRLTLELTDDDLPKLTILRAGAVR